MSNIKNDYLTIGSDDAPLKLEAFMNLACHGSRDFYNYAKEIYAENIEKGQLQVILKLYDKPREELLPGTLIHLFLDFSDSERTIEIITDLYATQDEWIKFPSNELKAMLVKKYHLPEEEVEENTEISLSFTREAMDREVKMVPTIFINGERKSLTFPLQKEEVSKILEEEIVKL